jgi:hypothetical protein
MNALDQALVDRCVASYTAWQPYAAKRDGIGPPRPTVPSVDAMLRREGITWERASTRTLYYRYTRAIRRRVGNYDRRTSEYRRSA